ncbi:multidrug effflux MFS transporter [Ferrimonas aestuarii]|uniref:Multidrug effflux MFS transporter n=1 Tax=Ferrimonas aestuarii TaxID=2569539 RepID=A0A4U1BVL3_9GAMM|nr:multidrug effflux MFS transporter [Ferrimonas aestuarii]TKB58504.1 multidrug effflux MFS transporter [Ferrimonas aestuarii]
MQIKKLMALAVVFALVPLGPMAIDLYLPSFPQMMTVFEASEPQIGQTISLYVLALGVGQLIAGPVSDRKGRKFSAMLGVFFYGLGSVLVLFSWSLEGLYGARMIQGLGAAFTMITAMAWIRDNYQGAEAGRWLSYLGGVTSAVPTVAPLLGTLLASYWGWQGGFWVMALLAALLFAMAYFCFDSPKPCQPTIEVVNSQQLKCRVRDILSDRRFLTYSLANTLSFGGLLTYISVAPIVGLTQGGLSQWTFSLMFGGIGGLQILSSLFAPWVINRLGRRRTVRFGASVIALGGIGLLWVDEVYGFFVLAAMGAAGFSLLSGSATSLALESFRHCAGLASAIDGFGRMIGAAVLVALATSLLGSGAMTLAAVLLLSVITVVAITLQGRQGEPAHER